MGAKGAWVSVPRLEESNPVPNSNIVVGTLARLKQFSVPRRISARLSNCHGRLSWLVWQYKRPSSANMQMLPRMTRQRWKCLELKISAPGHNLKGKISCRGSQTFHCLMSPIPFTHSISTKDHSQHSFFFHGPRGKRHVVSPRDFHSSHGSEGNKF